MLRRIVRKLKSVAGRKLEQQFPAVAEQVIDQVRKRYVERRGFIITDLISERLPPEERFVILDGGAREALSDPRWRVFDGKRVRLYGFEPDEKEIAELNAAAKQQGLDYRYFSGALWSEPATLTFYENKAPGGGSFYPQNTDLTARWKFQNQTDKFYARDIFYPTGTSQWTMTSIDRWIATMGAPIDIDFMKLNVQGAELEILKGAESVIDQVTGLMVEISFVESYKRRPFFSDIDSYLRAKGFYFFDLIGHHCMGRADSPITVRHMGGLYPLFGQLIEGHGIYFRDPIDQERQGVSIDHLSKDKLLKLVCFAEVFGQIEYAFELLLWMAGLLERRGDAAGAKEVRELAAEAERKYYKYLA